MAKFKPAIVPPSSVVHFDDRTALHLTQALHHETRLAGVLELIFSQLHRLTGAQGLTFEPAPEHEETAQKLELGKTAHHHVEYNLSVQDTAVGKLTIWFPARKNEHEIQTCEDLLGLAITALRNAVLLERAQPAETEKPETVRADALLLITLDDYADMERADGLEWANVVMGTVHQQIKDGLRNADGVYQISDEYIAVLLPNTTVEQALAVAEKVRVLIASLHLRANDVEQQLTACMGLADARLAATAEEVMANAKVALGEAQAKGRNQIQCYDETLVEALRARL